jgi:hypothetical protein
MNHDARSAQALQHQSSHSSSSPSQLRPTHRVGYGDVNTSTHTRRPLQQEPKDIATNHSLHANTVLATKKLCEVVEAHFYGAHAKHTDNETILK